MGPMNHQMLEVDQVVNLHGAVAPSSATPIRFSMKEFDRATILIFQNKSAGNGCAVSMNQAQDVSGTGSKTLSFTKAKRSLANGTQAAPVNAWESFDVASDTFTTDATNGTRDSYAIDITKDMLDIDNDFDVVELELGNAASNVIQAIAILHRARNAAFPNESGVAN